MHNGIYLVTDAGLCGPRGVLETVRVAVEAGVRTVQLRDKTSEAAVQLREVERLADVIAGQARLLVNDRLDVVLAARRRGIPVDGVHLGQGDAGAVAAREALGADATIGVTANTRAHLADLAQLEAGTVDYLGVGVIRPTSTKSDHPPALGVDGFARLVTATQLPCVAIGGIRLPDVPALRRAGAAGVAVVSAICAAVDPDAAARTLVRAWEASVQQEAPF